MEPPFMDEFEDLDELEELESEAAANRRQFLILVLGMGGILALAVIVLLFVILSRNGAKSDVELTNEAVLKTNAAIEKAVEATGTAEVVQVTAQAVALVATQEAQQAADATATAKAIAAATATAEAQPTPTQTRTPTPVVSSPTPTQVVEEGTPSEGGTAVAQVTATRTPTRRATQGATSTPPTGMGGLSVVLAAGALVVIVFVMRRLRAAT